jgi:hypothetical protein
MDPSGFFHFKRRFCGTAVKSATTNKTALKCESSSLIKLEKKQQQQISIKAFKM